MMATVIQHPAAIAPMPAVTRILARFDRRQLAGFIEVAIGLLDVMDGDADLEGSNWPEDVRAVDREHHHEDIEPIGDEGDAAWVEWHSSSRKKARTMLIAGHEDDELDDTDRCIED